MRKHKIDIKLHLIDPLIVATGCSWRRILGHSGRNVCVPTNNKNDNHPDLDASYEDLALLSAAPELYESNILLLNALNSVLSGKKVDNINDLRLIAEKALLKAEKSDF